MEIKPGQIYKHFKGGIYKILALGKHTEIGEDPVVYQDKEDNSKIWVRPKEMFLGEKQLENKKIKRFELID